MGAGGQGDDRFVFGRITSPSSLQPSSAVTVHPVSWQSFSVLTFFGEKIKKHLNIQLIMYYNDSNIISAVHKDNKHQRKPVPPRKNRPGVEV